MGGREGGREGSEEKIFGGRREIVSSFDGLDEIDWAGREGRKERGEEGRRSQKRCF